MVSCLEILGFALNRTTFTILRVSKMAQCKELNCSLSVKMHVDVCLEFWAAFVCQSSQVLLVPRGPCCWNCPPCCSVFVNKTISSCKLSLGKSSGVFSGLHVATERATAGTQSRILLIQKPVKKLSGLCCLCK